MRVLLITVPSLGHARSVASVAKGLVTAGHQVLWAANETVAGLAGPGVELALVAPRGAVEDGLDVPSGPASEINRWMLEQWFVPLAEESLGPTVDVARAFGPTVLLVDSTALWGPVAADLLGRPWATFCPGLLLNSWERNTLGTADADEAVNWARAVPGVSQDEGFWASERRLNRLRRDWGLPASENLNRLSPSLVLSFTTRDFDYGGFGLPSQVIHVGPVFASRDDIEPYPESEVPLPNDGRPLVYVTLGHVFGGRSDLREAILSDLAALDVGIIAAPGRPGETSEAVTNGRVFRPRTPVAQRSVLDTCATVVCHGGFNTVMESLCYGVPVVVAPIAADQWAIAGAVERSGLGVVVRSLGPGALSSAVNRVLTDVPMRQRAQRFRDEVRTMSAVPRSVRLLEQLGREGSVTMPGGVARLVRLPHAPVAAGRFRLTETESGGLAVASLATEHRLAATLDPAALRWLWPQLDGRHLLEELDEEWDGEADLMPLLEWLTDRGIIHEAMDPPADGAAGLYEDGLGRYKDQVYLFSHAESSDLPGSPAISGERLQRRLQAARVAVIGTGVLGSNVVRSLCLVGIGSLVLVDDGGLVDGELVARGAWYGAEQDDDRRAAVTLARSAVDLRPDLNVSVVGSVDVLPDLSDLHLVIVARDDWSADLDDRVDAAAHEARVQWTSIRRMNWEVEIGPTVIPYQSPCSLCFWSRREAVSPVRPTLSAPSFNLALGADLLTLECLKLLSGFSEAVTVGRMMVLDPLSMMLSRHTVLRRPRCPRCAASASVPHEAPWRPS